MINIHSSYNTVLDILYSKNMSIKELAKLSGRDIFTFYREADLNNLDLNGQDLTGLDFSGANLRGTKLNNAKIDLGSLNNSSIDDDYLYLTDEFDISAEDFIRIFDKNIYSYCKFREGWLDKILYSIGVPFSDFCAHAGIGESTLRKARRGAPVMTTTGLQICKGFKEEYWSNSGLYGNPPSNYLDMANISIGYYPAKNRWIRLSRKEYIEICRKSVEVFEYIFRGREDRFVEWNRGPDMVEWQYGFHIMDNFGRGHDQPI